MDLLESLIVLRLVTHIQYPYYILPLYSYDCATVTVSFNMTAVPAGFRLSTSANKIEEVRFMQFPLSFGFLLVGTAVNESQSVISLSLYLSISLNSLSLRKYHSTTTHSHTLTHVVILFCCSLFHFHLM